MDKYDVLKLSNQLCFPLYAASREIIKQYRPFLDDIGLTYTQYVVMLVLWENRCISVKKLGEKLYLDSGTLTPVLKSLAEKGYISRKRSQKDERVLIVSLTDAGKLIREKAVDIPSRIASCISLPENDAKELHRILYDILEK